MVQLPEVSSDAELTRDDALELLAAVQALADLRELEDVLAWLRTTARALTGADGATVVLAEGTHVFYADEDAISPLWKGRRFPADACISGWVTRHGQHVAIPDVYADPRVPHDAYRPTFVKSLAMVPLRRAQPIGALGAYWAVQHTPTAREVALLQALAHSAAVALDGARLLASERQARESAEREARLRQELVAMVSHDLRNPLSVVMMSVSLLAPLVVPLNGRARHHVDVSLRAARRMDALIHDLLDFGAIEAGELRVAQRATALEALFDAVGDLAPLAHERGLVLEVVPSPGHGGNVLCDAERVHQVFANLVSNALRFTPTGGTVTVRSAPRGGFFDFEVTDTGPGIAPEVLPRLFERFQRSARADGGGMGLGLYIARGIVEAHGGALRAENVPGLGARFTFSLPRVDGGAQLDASP